MLNMTADVRTVKDIASRIKKIVKENKEDDCHIELSEMLERLEEVKKPSIELLSQTKIGGVVQKLVEKSKTPKLDDNLRARATRLVLRWRKRVAKLQKKSTAAPVKLKKKKKAPEENKVKPSSIKSPKAAAKVQNNLPSPGSTPEERKTFFFKRFEFWNRDLTTETVRVTRRKLLFRKLGLHRASVQEALGKELSEEDIFERMVDTAEQLEIAISKISGGKIDDLKSRLHNLAHALKVNLPLVLRLLSKVC